MLGFLPCSRQMKLHAADRLISEHVGYDPGKTSRYKEILSLSVKFCLWQTLDMVRSDPSKYPQGFRTSTLYLTAQAHVQPYQTYAIIDLGCLHRPAIARNTHRRKVRHGPE